MTLDSIDSIRNWAEESLGDSLLDVWFEEYSGDNYSGKKLYEFKVLLKENLSGNTPDSIKEGVNGLPGESDIILVDFILYGWNSSRGPAHIVFYYDRQKIFDYFTRKEKEAEQSELENALDNDEEIFQDGYPYLVHSMREAGPGETFSVSDALDVYVGGPGYERRKNLLQVVILSSDVFAQLAEFNKKSRYKLENWQIKKENISKLFKRIKDWEKFPIWGSPSEEAEKLMD